MVVKPAAGTVRCSPTHASSSVIATSNSSVNPSPDHKHVTVDDSANTQRLRAQLGASALYNPKKCLPPPRRLCNIRRLFVCLLAISRKNYRCDLRENRAKYVSMDEEELIKFWKSSTLGHADTNLKTSTSLHCLFTVPLETGHRPILCTRYRASYLLLIRS